MLWKSLVANRYIILKLKERERERERGTTTNSEFKEENIAKPNPHPIHLAKKKIHKKTQLIILLYNKNQHKFLCTNQGGKKKTPN